MNLSRGLFRLWLVLSVVWIGGVAIFGLRLDHAATFQSESTLGQPYDPSVWEKFPRVSDSGSKPKGTKVVAYSDFVTPKPLPVSKAPSSPESPRSEVVLPSVEDMIADRLGQYAAAAPSDTSRLEQAKTLLALAPKVERSYLFKRICEEGGDPNLLGLPSEGH